ncbi:hypothetical protein BDQ12DRAFT_689164 [Crucibulum laeve]|uniref:Uncharacterized protein n=1 Tax=Crucibulum laeve TaxID=68775 RepID=A0A5C3LR40_9AGAR|nr:hypothetical protein BDQ12DRAFT_689164 [Crucibulum laeve]
MYIYPGALVTPASGSLLIIGSSAGVNRVSEWMMHVWGIFKDFIVMLHDTLVSWTVRVTPSLVSWIYFICTSLPDWAVKSCVAAYYFCHAHPHPLLLLLWTLFFGPIIFLLPFLLLQEVVFLVLFNASMVCHGLRRGSLTEQYTSLHSLLSEDYKEPVSHRIEQAANTYNAFTTRHPAFFVIRVVALGVGVGVAGGVWGFWSW